MIHRFDPATDQDGSVPIGKPIRNAQLYILDQHLTPVPPGITGEMCVGGAGVARGYLKRADLTAAKFVENPFNTGTTLYRTGDLARWSPDGQMQFLGRADDQVKVKGYRVELGEVESTLLTHSDVVSAVVTVFQPENALSATPEKQCVQCGLPDNYPGAEFDDNGVCDTCREYNALKIRFEPYFKTVDDLQPILERAKTGRQGQYDCLVLYSGGKDSSFMLYQLVRELGMTPLVFSLDNGYISEEAKTNMRRVTDDLGVDLVFGRTPHMNAVFVDSLKRHSNVCDGCFKVIYTLGISLARQKGINTIFTGLSRGQLFETRLSDMFHARIFDVDEIDRTVLEARKAYHRFDDAVTQLMDVSIFEDDQIFKDVQLVDFYRYTDVPLQEMYRYLDENAPWVRPSDTGRSTNCLINDAGIYIHKKTRGYHNYALPYSWDVRVGHKTRSEAVDELDDDLDETRVRQMLAEIGYDESENNRIQLAGYVVTRQPVSVTVLRDHLASYLPDYMLPTYLMQLDQLPLTPNGKVDRRALPRPEFGRIQVDTAFVAPDSTVEIQLADIWSEVLGAERVGVHDNFFELGGDSISTIRVTMRVSQAFQIELRPVALFEKPTVAQLADHIEAILIAEIEQMSDEEVELLLSKLD
jgi:non-ribosomal peptide synthetase component F